MILEASDLATFTWWNKSVDHSAKLRVIDKRVEPLIGILESNTKKIN